MHDTVEPAYPFLQPTRSRLGELIARLVRLYATCVTRGDTSLAVEEMKSHQREQVCNPPYQLGPRSTSDMPLFFPQIVWERDTVWRQMILSERRGEGEDGGPKSLITTNAAAAKPLFTIGGVKFKTKHLSLLVAVGVFAALLAFPTLESKEASRCLALLVFATILWATEVSVQSCLYPVVG